MNELDKARYNYYKLCYSRFFERTCKMQELLRVTKQVVGDLPIIREFNVEIEGLRRVLNEDLRQVIPTLIREDNYKTVPKIEKKKEC